MSSGNLLPKFKDVEFMLGPKAYISDPCYYRHLDWVGDIIALRMEFIQEEEESNEDAA